jgi:hypothetical protein
VRAIDRSIARSSRRPLFTYYLLIGDLLNEPFLKTNAIFGEHHKDIIREGKVSKAHERRWKTTSVVVRFLSRVR